MGLGGKRWGRVVRVGAGSAKGLGDVVRFGEGDMAVFRWGGR